MLINELETIRWYLDNLVERLGPTDATNEINDAFGALDERLTAMQATIQRLEAALERGDGYDLSAALDWGAAQAAKATELPTILADSEHYRAALEAAARAGYRWQRHIQAIGVYHGETCIGEASRIDEAERIILERVYGA
jgi:hypothetical protein